MSSAQSSNFVTGENSPVSSDIYHFQNQLPTDDLQQGPKSQERGPRWNAWVSASQPGVVTRSLFWPSVLTIIPIALVSASLLLLVFRYEVKSADSIFASPPNDTEHSASFILVDFPATRIVFAASFLSTIAPILASFIMAMWALPIAESLRTASQGNDLQDLPTPYQLSLTVGLTLASYEQLRQYLHYTLSRSRRASIPPVLNRAALMLLCSLLLAVGVFISDVCLHYYTETIEFDKISRVNGSSLMYGRGLSEQCISFNRLDNQGFPCSFDFAEGTNNPELFTAQENELFYLQQNESQRAEIRLYTDEDLPLGDLAILIPKSETIQTKVDYATSTIGVSTQCRLISDQCRWKHLSDPWDEPYFHFNCSKDFYGNLGMPPVSDGNNPNLSSLAYNPAKSIIYSFFSDASLHDVYNTIGYNKTLQVTLPPMPDSELRNSIHMAFAGQFATTSEAAGSNLGQQPGFYMDPDFSIVNFAVDCSITTYDVKYSWVNGAISQASYTPSQNGSMLEIFHGRQTYATSDGSAYDLAISLLQAALSSDGDAFARRWSDLYSVKVLSTIGAYTSPRTNLREQSRQNLLVAKVPRPALGFLLGCSLTYTLIGIVLGCRAWKSSSSDNRELAAQVSIAGLTAAAFDVTNAETPMSQSSYLKTTTFDEKGPNTDPGRVVVHGNAQTGYSLGLWV